MFILERYVGRFFLENQQKMMIDPFCTSPNTKPAETREFCDILSVFQIDFLRSAEERKHFRYPIQRVYRNFF